MDSKTTPRHSVLKPDEHNHPKGNRLAAWSYLRSPSTAVVGLWLLLASGCATTGPYNYGTFHPGRPTRTDVTEVAIDYGAPNKTLDRIGNILGTPAKLLSLNSRIDNHHVSDETLEKLITYMEKNDITDVCVAVNDYSPKDQWRRLTENERISPGWKYTVGTLSWVGYTISPGRLFGGTQYSPYTNTLYVNSDVPALLLAEAAYAKDIHSRQFPGTYAVFANGLPVVKIWRQSRAINDVLSYARVEQDWDVEKEAYRVLYPQMGASTLGGAGVLVMGSPGSLSSFIISPLFGISGAAIGHVAGRSMSRRRESELNHVAALNELLSNTERSTTSPEEFDDSPRDRIPEADGVRETTIIRTSHSDEQSDALLDDETAFDSDDRVEGSQRQQR